MIATTEVESLELERLRWPGATEVDVRASADGAQVVSVPTEVAFARAQQAFVTFMGSLVVVLAVIGLILNLLLWRMFIRPVSKISSLADRISRGELEAPDIQVRGRDEIRTLAESIARLRKSLAQAMQLLET